MRRSSGGDDAGGAVVDSAIGKITVLPDPAWQEFAVRVPAGKRSCDAQTQGIAALSPGHNPKTAIGTNPGRDMLCVSF